MSQPMVFEVATIKPSPPPSSAGSSSAICHGVDSFVPSFQAGMALRAPARGRCLLTHYSLKAALAFAYHPEQVTPFTVEDRVAGGPAWASSDLFDIEGKAQDVASTTESQLHSMLRQLLTDRFKLRTHIEKRGVKGYALVLAKNGHKMQRGTGSSSTVRYSPRRGMSASNAPMNLFALELGRLVKAPVVDQTGLNGGYAFSLPVTSGIDPSGRSIFTLLQEELGLRLEATKLALDVIVIDRAEKPSEN